MGESGASPAPSTTDDVVTIGVLLLELLVVAVATEDPIGVVLALSWAATASAVRVDENCLGELSGSFFCC